MTTSYPYIIQRFYKMTDKIIVQYSQNTYKTLYAAKKAYFKWKTAEEQKVEKIKRLRKEKEQAEKDGKSCDKINIIKAKIDQFAKADLLKSCQFIGALIVKRDSDNLAAAILAETAKFYKEK